MTIPRSVKEADNAHFDGNNDEYHTIITKTSKALSAFRITCYIGFFILALSLVALASQVSLTFMCASIGILIIVFAIFYLILESITSLHHHTDMWKEHKDAYDKVNYRRQVGKNRPVWHAHIC